jgi:hypothetical protein
MWALPLSQWTVVATNVVNTSGAGQQFYIMSNTNN